MNTKIKSAGLWLVLSGWFTLTGLSAFAHSDPYKPEVKERPNVLIIMADDLDSRQLSCYGGQNLQTKHIDELASAGMKFNQMIASEAMCIPTRASLFTGLYPLKHGAYQNHKPVYGHLKSVNHYLGDLGYRVGLTGKDHMTTPRSVFPFDRIKGFEPNCVSATDVYFLDSVKNYISQKDPFCLFIMSNNPHAPWTVGDQSEFHPEDLKLPAHWVDTKKTRADFAKYLAEVRRLDNQVGEVMEMLKASGKDKNTIVIFLGEQGPQFPGGKWTLYDNGQKSSMIVRWPGVVKGGSSTAAIVQYEDITPTLVDIAGGKAIAGLDGKSILKVLTHKSDHHRDFAYGIHNNIPEGPKYAIRSIRDQHYKLLLNLDHEGAYRIKWMMNPDQTNTVWYSWLQKAKTDPQAKILTDRITHRPALEFYDLINDPQELNNLAKNQIHQPLIAKFQLKLNAWMKEQGDPGAAIDKPVTLTPQNQGQDTFNNPIADGADPWIIKHEGIYYVCQSGKNDSESYISVAKSASPTKMGKRVRVWTAPKTGWNSDCVWAPELHRIGNKWYIYYAAGSSGPPYIHQRSGVLESVTDNPLGPYVEKSILKTGEDVNDPVKTIWAIDVTVANINGKLYGTWSGWEKNAPTDKTKQHLYIAEMSNPWTFKGPRVKISSPEQSWETGGELDLNEGPQFLQKNGNTFIVYSTRESWLATYRLGMLRLKDPKGSPLDPTNWIKKGPVFMGTKEVHGVGHASFTTSPDDKEDWIFYHTKKEMSPGWNRDMRLQKFHWDENGDPIFGTPVPAHVPLKRPSGDLGMVTIPQQLSSFQTLQKDFKTHINGKPVALYILKNSRGAEVAITNYGCRLVGLLVPDKNGVLRDVITGYKRIADYQKPKAAFYGPIVGRFANRINKGKFVLDGQHYQSSINNGPNMLHGGKEGFYTKVWEAAQPNPHSLVLKYLSPDGEEGFPGNLNITLTYSFNDSNELKMEYQAITDKKTVLNLTNHSFFNLNGEGSGTILNHHLQIHADRYTPIDETLIPDGTLSSVAGTPFDFRKATTIGSRIDQSHVQLLNGKGYDHNFVINMPKKGINHIARFTGDLSGIVMDIYSTEPGLQFYSGNFFTGNSILKSGTRDVFRSAVALETQHFPDSPNQPSFPSTVLGPGQKYYSQSIYKFSTK